MAAQRKQSRLLSFNLGDVEKGMPPKIVAKSEPQKPTTSSDSHEETVQQRLKNFIPLVILIIFSLVSGALVYGADRIQPPKIDLPNGPSVEGCIGNRDYWAALEYLNSIITTIGYGNIYACSTAARTVTVICAIIGVPLVIISLNNIGDEIAACVQALWKPIGKRVYKLKKRWIKRHANHPGIVSKYKQKKWRTTDDVPFWAIILMNIGWILISAVYFSIMEGWRYEDAIYFAFVSTFTIGLGDYAPRQFEWTILTYTFIFIGLALVSASIKLGQAKQEIIIRMFEEKLARLQRKAFAHEKLQLPIQKDQPAAVVDDFMKESWITWLFPQKRRKFLERKAAKVLKNEISTQTDQADLEPIDPHVLLHRSNSLDDLKVLLDVDNVVPAPVLNRKLSSTSTATSGGGIGPFYTRQLSRLSTRSRVSVVYSDHFLESAMERGSSMRLPRRMPSFKDAQAAHRPLLANITVETTADVLAEVPEEGETTTSSNSTLNTTHTTLDDISEEVEHTAT